MIFLSGLSLGFFPARWPQDSWAAIGWLKPTRVSIPANKAETAHLFHPNLKSHTGLPLPSSIDSQLATRFKGRGIRFHGLMGEQLGSRTACVIKDVEAIFGK